MKFKEKSLREIEEYVNDCVHIDEITALDILFELNTRSDQELTHCIADDLLCRILIQDGYIDIIRAYREIDKWYA